jgi:hypothetical protein
MASNTSHPHRNRVAAPVVMATPAGRVARSAIDARHDLERRDLYRSKATGPHAISHERMKELERTYADSAARLQAAEADACAAIDAQRAIAAAGPVEPETPRDRRHLRLVLPDTRAEPNSPAIPVAMAGLGRAAVAPAP